MMGLLNVGSLLFGLIAWILPVINLMRSDKSNLKKMMLFSLLSLISCLISLYMQILAKHYLLVIEDWAALLDTMYIFEIISGIVLVVSVTLNLLSFSVTEASK